MPVYKDKALERIREKLRPTASVINKALKSNTKEADTRTIVLDILTEMLGWDKFENITAEYAIKGGYADYAIVKTDEKGRRVIYAIVEIKQIGMKLNEGHIRQAKNYAVNEGVKWVIVTNANDWMVFRIEFNKRKQQPTPEAYPVFSVTINDTDIRPGERAEEIYLLSEEASRKNELEEWYQKWLAISPDNLVKKILSGEVLDRIRLAIKHEINVNFSNEEIATQIIENVIREDTKPQNSAYYLKKLAK
ncbi:MAG: type I restriction enzyme HsdR N-terminal domain-containing protein [Firmicutes bacterium]|nr:type I restriction enzyme HsdR N-terminal domain-containing protein [Bacillota bacterium]